MRRHRSTESLILSIPLLLFRRCDALHQPAYVLGQQIEIRHSLAVLKHSSLPIAENNIHPRRAYQIHLIPQEEDIHEGKSAAPPRASCNSERGPYFPRECTCMQIIFVLFLATCGTTKGMSPSRRPDTTGHQFGCGAIRVYRRRNNDPFRLEQLCIDFFEIVLNNTTAQTPAAITGSAHFDSFVRQANHFNVKATPFEVREQPLHEQFGIALFSSTADDSDHVCHGRPPYPHPPPLRP